MLFMTMIQQCLDMRAENFSNCCLFRNTTVNHNASNDGGIILIYPRHTKTKTYCRATRFIWLRREPQS